jgi:cytochrome c oxidase assembly protein subunit 15
MATAITEERGVRQHDYGRIRWWIRLWLWAIAFIIMVMVVVGGTTRLTHAGLSITDWQLIHGVIPPLSNADWLEEFAKYKLIPEFQQLNANMSLEEFKGIFWWEYTHRLLGRILGLVVLLPLIFLWATGRIERILLPRLLTIAGLVVFQGIVGWWMVESGLAATDVSPLWLTFHLTLGTFTLAFVTSVATSLSNSTMPEAKRSYRVMAMAILVVTFVQVFYGGLMAGTNAGFTLNTWPLMDGQFIPTRLLFDGFTLGNLVSDIPTIQFIHRMTAYLLLIMVLVHLVQTWRSDFAAPVFALLWLVAVQMLFGIITLLLTVPLLFALLHQFGAVLVIFTAVIHWRAMSPPLPRPVPVGV